MKITFFDREYSSNPLHGTSISDASQLESVWESLRNREPFFCEFDGENGYKLTVGLADEIGCVEHSRSDGGPPYSMTLTNDHDEGYVEFLFVGTLTPIPRRHCVPIAVVKQVVREFLDTGIRSDVVAWEEI